MLDGEALRGEPQRRLATGQRLLPVQAPVLEASVTEGVQYPQEPRGEECPPQLLLPVADAGHEAQNLQRRPAAVLALAVRPVGLVVVVLHEPRVGSSCLSS